MAVPGHSEIADLLPGLTSRVPIEHGGEVDVVFIPATRYIEVVADHGGS